MMIPQPFQLSVLSEIIAASAREFVTFTGMELMPGSISVSNRMMNGELNPSGALSTRRITPPEQSRPASWKSEPFNSFPLPAVGLCVALLTDGILFCVLFG